MALRQARGTHTREVGPQSVLREVVASVAAGADGLGFPFIHVGLLLRRSRVGAKSESTFGKVERMEQFMTQVHLRWPCDLVTAAVFSSIAEIWIISDDRSCAHAYPCLDPADPAVRTGIILVVSCWFDE